MGETETIFSKAKILWMPAWWFMPAIPATYDVGGGENFGPGWPEQNP
jgi:hypothetical protein